MFFTMGSSAAGAGAGAGAAGAGASFPRLHPIAPNYAPDLCDVTALILTSPGNSDASDRRPKFGRRTRRVPLPSGHTHGAHGRTRSTGCHVCRINVHTGTRITQTRDCMQFEEPPHTTNEGSHDARGVLLRSYVCRSDVVSSSNLSVLQLG